jgi:hypothetical protein
LGSIPSTTRFFEKLWSGMVSSQTCEDN